MNNFSNGIYIFFIPGKLPGLNEYTRANRTHRQKGAKLKDETDQYVAYCVMNKLRGLQIKNPVHIKYTWVEENQKRDLDNIAFAKKFIQDALVKLGVLENDGWKNITGFEDHFEVNKKEPGVLVEIVEVDNDQRAQEDPQQEIL